ncbi:hypothetical protein THRCLA_09611 [Thraustotheca clavata]|uniref:Uncharacterized protein n=1 Tax=Thraustotheca clavata TaxID=74557 RepID=A0A1V9YVB5_9STRA|nr:hypothetical protein THRCLA_09611 [Thraustotheca clavata]
MLKFAVEECYANIVEIILSCTQRSIAVSREIQTALVIAAQCGNCVIAHLLLQHGANPLERDEGGYVPIYLAAEYRHVDVLREFWQDPSIYPPIAKETVLHKAATLGNLDIACYLIKKGANVNAPSRAGLIPLHNAVASGHIALVKLLLDHGSNVNTIGKSGITVLHSALTHPSASVIKLLLDYGVNTSVPTMDGRIYLMHLVDTPACNEILDYLAPNSYNFDYQVPPKNKRSKSFIGATLLLLATSLNKIDIVHRLLQLGASIDLAHPTGATALHIASWCGFVDMAKLLINAGANVHTTVHSVQFLWGLRVCNYVKSATTTACTPLHLACLQGHIDILKLFEPLLCIDFNATDNILNLNGYALACLAGQLDAVLYLTNIPSIMVKTTSGNVVMAHSPNSTSSFFTQLLYPVVKEKQYDVVCFLLNNGADPNVQQTETGATPLFAAVQANHQRLSEILIQHGANPNIGLYNGDTPLCESITKSTFSSRVLELLLPSDANPYQTLNAGLTPFYEYFGAKDNDYYHYDEIIRAYDYFLQNDFVLDINCQLQTGIHKDATSLFYAAYCISEELTLRFTGATPLHITCINDMEQLTVALIRAGADCELFDYLKVRLSWRNQWKLENEYKNHCTPMYVHSDDHMREELTKYPSFGVNAQEPRTILKVY